MFLGFKSPTCRGRALAAVALAAAFAAGILAAAALRPVSQGRAVAAPAPKHQAAFGYPADVVRVLDGDTFEARVRVWPGIEITTKVRLRGVDAPELRARCVAERVKAQAARDALAALLAQGAVGVTRVSLGKYGGRVIADASAGDTVSIAEALLAAGHVRRYGRGRRGGWCGG